MEKKNVLPVQSRSRSLRDIRVLCAISLFIAMYTALQAVQISLSPTLRVTFSYLALAASCYYFGVWPNILAAFVCDFLGYIVHPDGAYMPLFALVIISKAIIYALGFYGRDKISVWRVITVHFIATLLCSVLLNPLILKIMYQMPYWVLVSSRLLKNAILFPIECVLLYMILQLCIKLKKRISWL